METDTKWERKNCTFLCGTHDAMVGYGYGRPAAGGTDREPTTMVAKNFNVDHTGRYLPACLPSYVWLGRARRPVQQRDDDRAAARRAMLGT